MVARSTWLFGPAELNPRGVRIDPAVAAALKDRYDFQAQTRVEEPFPFLQFSNGGFKADGKRQGWLPRDDVPTGTQLVIVPGDDGTRLSAARSIGERAIPLSAPWRLGDAEVGIR